MCWRRRRRVCSSEIFHLFDDLILMADGKVMHAGACDPAVDYFALRGFPCPKYTNPADYIFMAVLNNEDASESTPTVASSPRESNQERDDSCHCFQTHVVGLFQCM
ncbi:hypothetical protein SeMB42_g04473 [Synchytrium endobioticum]|nr:hypothetical protein SeMB42_g04473 [Synchytrium endobioticum]